ncbi:hypothetical protein BSKO_02431 [Bryopsis sp. KO-2023]|nr:hypothetical protein BSKO_02431 [Bryopsis sp. KO-2023]
MINKHNAELEMRDKEIENLKAELCEKNAELQEQNAIMENMGVEKNIELRDLKAELREKNAVIENVCATMGGIQLRRGVALEGSSIRTIDSSSDITSQGAGGGNPGAQGNNLKAKDINLETGLQDHIAQATDFHRGGVMTKNFTLLRETNIPAVYITPGFVTNFDQSVRLKDSRTIKAIGAAIAEGIHSWAVNCE